MLPERGKAEREQRRYLRLKGGSPISLVRSVTRPPASALRPATTASPACSTNSPSTGATGLYPKLVQRLARTWLLILDNWGLASLSGQGPRDLLAVLDDRYARHGALLASQVPVDRWHDVIGDPALGNAILDRLFNNAHRITLKGSSMRRVYDSTKCDSTLGALLHGALQLRARNPASPACNGRPP